MILVTACTARSERLTRYYSKVLRKSVQLSTLCLVTVALFDLVTTMMLLSAGFGESNPLFSYLLRFGSLAFVLAKVAFLAGSILILEYVRERHPKSAEQGTWIAFFAYSALYVTHLVRHFSA